MASDFSDLIILVHGTGASADSDIGSHWWQCNSAFSNRLKLLVGSCAEVASPFHWTGANSELARRRAGRELLQRLREIDESGRGYHLVGHSHGGSVIWHTLTQSAAQGKQLANLRSWCTVGTPFLTFAPRWPDAWRWVTAAFVSAIFIVLIYTSSFSELPGIVRENWFNGARWTLIGYCVLLLAAAMFWLLVIARALLPTLAAALFSIRPVAPALARDWYRGRWLGLWHPLDEPINSLALTLNPAPEIAPRRRESRLFRALPFLGAIWDKVLMRAADQFAWRQVTDRAQGADLANQSVLDEGRAPPPLVPGFDPLSQDLADELEASANEKSAEAVKKFRMQLENAYRERSTETIVDRMGTALTFQELIHTSYFDHPKIAELIAAHITTPVGQPRSPLLPEWAKPDPGRGKHALPPRGALEFITGVVLFVLPALGLWLSISVVNRAAVMPYTEAYYLESVKDYVTDIRVLSAGNGSKLASLLLGLEARHAVGDPIGLLVQIPFDEHRRQAAMRLAYAYGRAGRIKDVQRLIDRDEPENLKEAYQTRIRLLGFIGRAATHAPTEKAAAGGWQTGDDQAFTKLLDPYLDHLSDSSFTGDLDLAELAIEQMGLSGQTELAQRMLDFALRAAGHPDGTTCDLAGAAAAGRALASPDADLTVLLKFCPEDADREDLKRGVARRVLTSRKIEGLYAYAVANKYPLWPPDKIEDFLFTAKDEDDLQRKIGAVLPDIVLMERVLPPDQIGLLSRDDSWASRLARNYVGPIASLAQWTRDLGATRLSDALLDVIVRQSANTTEPMESYLAQSVRALAAGKRLDAIDKLSSKYQDQVNSSPPQSADQRLQTLALLIGAASAQGDSKKVLRYGDEVLTIKVAQSSLQTSSSILTVAEAVLNVDKTQERARPLLNKALYYAAMDQNDIARNINLKLAMNDLVQAGAIRQALNTAAQIGDTDLALDALLGIVKHLDRSGSYDLRELGNRADRMKKLWERDDNPFEQSNPFERSNE